MMNVCVNVQSILQFGVKMSQDIADKLGSDFYFKKMDSLFKMMDFVFTMMILYLQ